MESIITHESLSKDNSKSWRFRRTCRFILHLCCCVLFVLPARSQIDPSIATNKDDYTVGETVNITGYTWNPGEVVELVITESSTQSIDTINAVADANGEVLNTDYLIVDGTSYFNLDATGLESGAQASKVFTNSSGLMQAHNGGVGDTPISPVIWVNGNAHGGNSHYMEGQSIPYRLILKDVEVGAHELEIGFDIRDGGKTAIDFITSNDRIDEIVDPIIDLAGPFDPPTTFNIPAPENSVVVTGYYGDQPQPIYTFNKLGEDEKHITVFNAVIDSAVYTDPGDFTLDHSEARIKFYFHVTGSMKDVVFSWGGHIASRLDWWLDNSAAEINGSPYHTRFIAFDGKGGNQDRSLKTDAVQFKPTCGISGPDEVCGNTAITFYGSSNGPAPTYSWFVTGGASIVGSSTLDSVVVLAPASGSFDVYMNVVDMTGGVASLASDTCHMSVNVLVDPVVDAGLDDEQCKDENGNTFDIAGSVSAGQAEWSIIQGQGVIDDSSALNTSVLALSDTLVLRLTALESCEETYDDVVLIVYDVQEPDIQGTDPSCQNPSGLYYTGFSDQEYTFSWSISGNATISGSTDNDSVVVIPDSPCAADFTLTLQVTNIESGCVSSHDTIVSFADNNAPSIFGQGSDMTISCPEVQAFTPPSASDDCDLNPEIVLVSDITIPGSCAGTYTRTKTWKAVDDCGNESGTVSQAITVVDNVAPSIFGAGADATISCPAVPQFTAPQASDDCDPNPQIILVSDITTPGACAGAYSRTKTWKAVDACGNESGLVSQTITVEDNSAPSIFGQGPDQSLDCPATGQFTEPQALDDCDPNPQIVLVSDITTPGACAGSYSRTKTWKAVDACGNESGTVSQTITVVDNTAPSILGAGADATINCPAVPQFTAPYALDNCDPNPQIILVSDITTPGACAGSYSRTKTWKAVDACGNESGLVSQTIIVVDNIAPSIFGQGADATINCPAVPQFTDPQTSDDCDPNPQIILVSDITSPGACAGSYSRTKTWKAVDACGNESGLVSQTITVVDNIAPSIFGQGADATISCPAVPQFAAPQASDDCDPNPQVILVSDITTPGACAGSYSRTKTWKAVDACGNESGLVSQTITVVDDGVPSIFGGGADATISCPAVPQFTEPQASDDCDPNPQVILVSDITTPGACAGSYSRTKTWKAVDACGNESGLVSQTITVIDDSAPSIFGQGADMTIDCPAVPQFTDPQASDDCDPNPQIVLVSDITVPGSCPGTYSRTKTWKAVDDCGNESGTVSQTITVIDNTAPVFTFVPDDEDIFCPAEPVFTPPVAVDECGVATVHQVGADTVYMADGSVHYSMTWNAVDECGNQTHEVTQTIVLRCVKTFCSLTQGFYGNNHGIACATGEETDELLHRLLGDDFGDLYIGLPGQSFNITDEDVECLIEKLPAGGKPVKLPMGDNSFGADCKTGTSLDAKSKFNNVLLGQIITLGLNLRLDEDLGGIYLEGSQIVTYGSLPQEDGLCGTEDDIVDDLDVVVKNIPISVLNAIDAEYNYERTIANLYLLANRAIGGEDIQGVSLSAINKAVSAINEGFDHCRYLGGFNKSNFEEEEFVIEETELEYDVFPNPFHEELNITFLSNIDSDVQIELLSLNGERLRSLYDDRVEAETPYHIIVDAADLPNGLYLLRIYHNDKVYINRVVVN